MTSYMYLSALYIIEIKYYKTLDKPNNDSIYRIATIVTEQSLPGWARLNLL